MCHMSLYVLLTNDSQDLHGGKLEVIGMRQGNGGSQILVSNHQAVLDVIQWRASPTPVGIVPALHKRAIIFASCPTLIV